MGEETSSVEAVITCSSERFRVKLSGALTPWLRHLNLLAASGVFVKALGAQL